MGKARGGQASGATVSGCSPDASSCVKRAEVCSAAAACSAPTHSFEIVVGTPVFAEKATLSGPSRKLEAYQPLCADRGVKSWLSVPKAFGILSRVR